MSIKPRKVIIIGAGNVGAHCGLSLVMNGQTDELVYIDMDREKALGQVMDMDDITPYLPKKITIRAGDYTECDDADIIVMTAGRGRKPGETRTELLESVVRVAKSIADPIKKTKFSGILLVISNPADIITDFMAKSLGLPKTRVFSTGTSLDTARLKRYLGNALDVDRSSISALVIAEHGETQLIPYSLVTIGHRPLLSLMKEFPDTYGKLDLSEIAAKTKSGGADIIKNKGCTEFGIGMSCCDVVKAIFHNERRVIPVSAYLNGEYGQKGLYTGVPAIIGKNGVEEILELPLTKEEKDAFDKSCDAVRSYIEISDKNL